MSYVVLHWSRRGFNLPLLRTYLLKFTLRISFGKTRVPNGLVHLIWTRFLPNSFFLFPVHFLQPLLPRLHSLCQRLFLFQEFFLSFCLFLIHKFPHAFRAVGVRFFKVYPPLWRLLKVFFLSSFLSLRRGTFPSAASSWGAGLGSIFCWWKSSWRRMDPLGLVFHSISGGPDMSVFLTGLALEEKGPECLVCIPCGCTAAPFSLAGSNHSTLGSRALPHSFISLHSGAVFHHWHCPKSLTSFQRFCGKDLETTVM